MKVTTIFAVGMTNLACLVGVTPTLVFARSVVNVDASLPSEVSFHPTDGNAINGSIGSPAFSMLNESVTACHHLVHEDMSPARTTIIRDDCEKLARQVQTTNGFYELWQWFSAKKGQYQALVHNGTCEFAVKRLDRVVNKSTSDVAIIGNLDIFTILNATVFDFAGQADEPFMDNMFTHGQVNCNYWFSVNTTMDFRVQHTRSQDH